MHVINLQLEKSHILIYQSITPAEIYDSSTDSSQKFAARYTFENPAGLMISEVGMIYSKELLYLKEGNSGVYKQEGILENNNTVFISASSALSSSEDYYLRSYIIAEGKYYYGNVVYKFTTGTGVGDGHKTESIYTTNKHLSIHEYTVPAGYSVNVNGTIYGPGQFISLNQEGTYYFVETIFSPVYRVMSIIEIDKTPPVFSNVNSTDVFNVPITPYVNEKDIYISISKNNGANQEFANNIKITDKGVYTIALYDKAQNCSTYFFEIKDPEITSTSCFSVNTSSAEVSANFVNNGQILSKGFVYSSINNNPLIGDIGTSVYETSENLNQNFLTVTLENLAIFSNYHYRAFIKINDANNLPKYFYGAVNSFQTLQLSVPEFMMIYPTEIKRNKLAINSSIWNNGGSTITEKGVVYSTQSNPLIGAVGSTKVMSTSISNQSFDTEINNLSPGTNYYIKAYAINNSGTGYSPENMYQTTQEISVTFELDGGESNGGGALIQYGDVGFSPIPPIATKSNFNFAGWDKELDGITENTTITALWTDSKKYQVTFDPDGGQRTGGGELSQIVTSGFSAVAPILEKSGYNFAGWDTTFDKINKYTVVKAIWNVITFEVTFDLAGGQRTGGGAIVQTIEQGKAAIEPIIEKNESSFARWDKSFANITENTTITALWNVNRYQVTFYANTGIRTGGGNLSQLVDSGTDAVLPIVQKNGYKFLGFDKASTNIRENTTVVANYSAILSSEKNWTNVVYLSIDSTVNDMPMEMKIGDEAYRVVEKRNSIALEYNTTVLGRVFYNNEWIDLEPLVVTNIDTTPPENPTYSYKISSINPNLVELTFNLTEDLGSGILSHEYKIGKNGVWTQYFSSFKIDVPNNTYFIIRATNNAGLVAAQNARNISIDKVELVKENNSIVTRYVIKDEIPSGDSYVVKTINLRESALPDGTIYQSEYVHYPIGSEYLGCGIKAAQIFAEWFDISMPQGDVSYIGQYGKSDSNINYYVETTDFGLYIDWLTGGTWADPSIFTTPAQLENGIQAILNKKYSNLNVVRNSPNSTEAAVTKIESVLSKGYPVVILVNDGGHWQVISAARITRVNGEVNTAQFLVHDNSGKNWRTWGDIDYFFEDNFSAESARFFGYDSYRDCIMSVELRDNTPIPDTNQSTPINTISKNIIISPPSIDGDVADISIFNQDIQSALQGSLESNIVQITVNTSADLDRYDINLSSAAANTLANSNVDTHISTPIAGITFDNNAMRTLSSNSQMNNDIVISAGLADLSKLTREQRSEISGRPVYEFTAKSGDTLITDFEGGYATISLPYTRKMGEDINNITIYYVGSDGSLFSVPGCRFDPVLGRVIFRTNHFSLYAIGYNPVKFDDVENTAWYSSYVNFTTARGIFKGMSVDMFGPEIAMTRAMFITVLSNLEELNLSEYKDTGFKDVNINDWYDPSISWAKNNNIISGVDKESFMPNLEITREQAAVVMYNYCKYKNIEFKESDSLQFSDYENISDYAKDKVVSIRNNKIINGKPDNLFDPKAYITRAEAAVIIYNYINQLISD